MSTQPKTTKRWRGRPTLLTKRGDQIVAAVRAGAFLKTAAASAGVSQRTLTAWRSRGQAEIDRLDADERAKPLASEAPFVAFVQALEHAEAEAETVAVTTWMDAAREDWRAAAAFLQARFRQRWNPPPAQVQINLNLTPDELARLSDDDLAELRENRIPPSLQGRFKTS